MLKIVATCPNANTRGTCVYIFCQTQADRKWAKLFTATTTSGAGIGYLFDNWGLGLDYRHLDFDGSFDSFNIDDANLGGDVYLLRWQRNF